MAALEAEHLNALKEHLTEVYLPHLPPFLPPLKPAVEQETKNIARAFGAFALRALTEILPEDATQAVVDDWGDFGIDVVYYHSPNETLYLVQSKLKASEQFKQDEAQDFCRGVRKLIREDLDDFNANFQARRTEIEDSLGQCNRIILVVAHVGSGIAGTAELALNELLDDPTHGEERLIQPYEDFDADATLAEMREIQAPTKINATLIIKDPVHQTEPHITYIGLARLSDLVALHNTHRRSLYARNIRSFLGHKTDVNRSIQATLATSPETFVYLNNGVTALCREIAPRNSNANGKRLDTKELSIINGAQTIASAAHFVEGGGDASAASVVLTLIQAPADEAFGKVVTRARNHQNAVRPSSFTALEDGQERLRRDLAYLGVHYVYQDEAPDEVQDPNRIRVQEAAQALAIVHDDPRYVATLRRDPNRLLNVELNEYGAIFPATLTAARLLNAVRLNRYTQQRAVEWSNAATGQERLTYKNGNFALAWLVARRIRTTLNGAALIDPSKIEGAIGQEIDQMRQDLWNEVEGRIKATGFDPGTYAMGPLALFRRQGEVISILQAVQIENFALASNAALPPLLAQQSAVALYPVALFNFLASQAPQAGGLT